MLKRMSLAAMLLGLVAWGGNSAMATGNECEFTFWFHNPPSLTVECGVMGSPAAGGSCLGSIRHAHINVKTNACTMLCWDATDFLRPESNCEGVQYTSQSPRPNFAYNDRIGSCVCIGLTDNNPGAGGNPLKLDKYPQILLGQGNGYTVPSNKDCVEVESHNGGYTVHIRVFPNGLQTLADDDGCYSAKITFTVGVIPMVCPPIPSSWFNAFGLPSGT